MCINLANHTHEMSLCFDSVSYFAESKVRFLGQSSVPTSKIYHKEENKSKLPREGKRRDPGNKDVVDN